LKTPILGGVKSGKSNLAQSLATDTALPVRLIAAALAQDSEMKARIERHKTNRPSGWTVIEEPYSVGSILNNSCLPVPQCVTQRCRITHGIKRSKA